MVDEAQELDEAPKTRRGKAAAADFVKFVSRNPESYQWTIMGIRAQRDADDMERVCWMVPAGIANEFDKHFFCRRGRVTRAK